MVGVIVGFLGIGIMGICTIIAFTAWVFGFASGFMVITPFLVWLGIIVLIWIVEIWISWKP